MSNALEIFKVLMTPGSAKQLVGAGFIPLWERTIWDDLVCTIVRNG